LPAGKKWTVRNARIGNATGFLILVSWPNWEGCLSRRRRTCPLQVESGLAHVLDQGSQLGEIGPDVANALRAELAGFAISSTPL
jgi:hypothetical protein